MSPELRARVTAKNDTAAGFAEVKRDAIATASAIEASGGRAASGLKVQSTALQALAGSSRMAAMQQRNLVFQLNDIGVSLAGGMNPLMVLAQQGSQIATIWGPEEGGVARALQETGKMAVGLVAKFAPVLALVGAGTAAIGGLASEINKVSDVQVTFGDVALGVWQTFADGIYTLAQPALSSVAKWSSELWESVRPSLVSLGNGIIGTFVFAYDATLLSWQMLPTALGDIAITTANAVIDGMEMMINGSIGLLNDFTRGARDAFGAIGIDVQDIGRVSLGNFANPFAGYADDLTTELDIAAGAIGRVDYMGSLFGSIAGNARKSALTRLAEDADRAGKATKSLAKEGFGQLIGATNVFADATRSAFSNIGSSLVEAFKKGGNVAVNVLDTIIGRVGQLGESLLNQGLNSLLDIGISALFGGLGGGLGTGAIGRGVYGGLGGFFPAFPGMASGGRVARSGLSWVGERGPELLRLPRGAEVIPNPASMRLANDNGGGTFAPVFNINGSGLSEAQLEGAITRALNTYRRFGFHDDWERHANDRLARG